MRKVWGKVADVIKLIYAYTSVLLVFGSLFALIASIALVIMVSLVEFWYSNIVCSRNAFPDSLRNYWA